MAVAMTDKTYRRLADMLLGAMYHPRDRGETSSFLFGPVGAGDLDKRFGVSIYYDEAELAKSALFARQEGPNYLRKVPISYIRALLIDFIADHYWLLKDEAMFGGAFECSYAEKLSEAPKQALAHALSSSGVFKPRSTLFLFPLGAVRVERAFQSNAFFLVDTRSLDEIQLPGGLSGHELDGNQFPPMADWKGKKWRPTAWLGISSPAQVVARRVKNAVLGALALTPLPQYRRQFTSQDTVGGICTIDDRTAGVSVTAPHVPPLSETIILARNDNEWLMMLSEQLASPDKAERRNMQALEYYYRSWFLGPSERFPILFFVLDSLFGSIADGTKAVVEGAHHLLGVDRDRMRLLCRLRNAVVHGGAPEVYDSTKYARYYQEYGADPVDDVELVVADSLRVTIFDGRLGEHPDPNAELIAELEAAGRLPQRRECSILARRRSQSRDDSET